MSDVNQQTLQRLDSFTRKLEAGEIVITPIDLEVKLAAAWMIGAHAAFRERGFPKAIDRAEFLNHVGTALELAKYGSTARGPLVLYELVDYVAAKAFPPLWAD